MVGESKGIIRFVAVFAVFSITVLASLLLAPQLAHAGGGLGGGGTGSGSGGGANTNNGYGWYIFNTDGSGGSPRGMRNGQSWANSQATCRAAGANQIYAFIVQTTPPPSENPQAAVVYDYWTGKRGSEDGYNGYYRNLGFNHGNWRDPQTAQAEFNNLPANGVSTAGYTFGGPGGNVGWFCSDFQPRWTVSPGVSVDRATAIPGDKITWTHSVHNNGQVQTGGVTYGYTANFNPFGPAAVGGPVGIPPNGTVSQRSAHVVTQNDVGTNVCRATYAAPQSGNNGNPTSTGYACVGIPYSYTLTPSVALDHSGDASVGTPVNVQPSVTNSGPTKTKPTDWQVTQFVVAPGKAVPNNAGGPSPSAPCVYFTANVTSCTSPLNNDKGNGTVFNGGNGGKVTNSTTSLSATGAVLPDAPVGSRVCFALSVKPFSSGNVNWGHSAPVCLIVSKSPQVQILGNDLRVGAVFPGDTPADSQISTSVTIKTNKSYGSWDEYGVAAAGSIAGIGSASAYSGGLSCTINCATNNLTFANTPTIGNFKPTTKIPDVAATFPVTGSTPLFSSIGDTTLRRVETANGNITIGGGTIQKGDWLVINAPSSTVTITGDINYTNVALGGIGEIPQLVIIANQINIDGSVKNVDAWLIASGAQGTINTCSSWKGAALAPTDQLASGICSDPLVINGPVMAKKLYLRRTAGADSGAGSANPAEVINLRPDAYLWGIAHNADSGRLPTVFESELPPRF